MGVREPCSRRVPGPGCVVMGPFADIQCARGTTAFPRLPPERRPPPARSLCEDRARRGSDARFRPQRAVGRDDREVVPSFVPMRGRPRRRVSLLLSESRVCRTRGRQLSASGRGGASATRHTPAGGRSRERLRSFSAASLDVSRAWQPGRSRGPARRRRSDVGGRSAAPGP